MTPIHYAPRAHADLDAITDFFRTRNPPAGHRLLDAIEECGAFLIANPGAGDECDDLGTGLRAYPVRGYVVYYRNVPNGIEVARIFHSARQPKPWMFR